VATDILANDRFHLSREHRAHPCRSDRCPRARAVEEARSAWPLRRRERCDTKPVIGTEAESGADGDEEREGDLTRGHVRPQVRVQPQAGEDAGVRDDEQKALVDPWSRACRAPER